MEPEEFELAPKIGKPSAKLGEVLDLTHKLISNVPEGEDVELEDAIKRAALKVDYYGSLIDKKIDVIKEAYNKYISALNNIGNPPKGKEWIVLSDKDWDLVNSCVKSCLENKEIYDKLHPTDVFGDPIESHFEDAFFMNFIVTYKGKQCAYIPFKMKADNWTIDFENKILTLNDLKSTSHSVQTFMRENGSWLNFNYARQMYAYSFVLWFFCIYNCGVSKHTGWRLNTNMLVVETIPNYWSRSFYVTDEQLREGKRMFDNLLKRVGYYEIFGYDEEVEFI